jgi:hypothetical protein
VTFSDALLLAAAALISFGTVVMSFLYGTAEQVRRPGPPFYRDRVRQSNGLGCTRSGSRLLRR